VWFHGGGFVSGAGSFYGPEHLLDEDIVLVTVNYRLGPIGKAICISSFGNPFNTTTPYNTNGSSSGDKVTGA